MTELLTKATVTSSEKTKLENLQRVSDILINKQPALLDNFLNEMLDFQTDSNADVRKFILDFVESAWYAARRMRLLGIYFCRTLLK